MKRILAFGALLLCFGSSYGQNQYGGPAVDPLVVQQRLATWLTYQHDHIRLWGDYVALDVQGNTITKEAFLKELTSGKYLPIALQSKDAKVYYQLFTLAPGSDSSISATIGQKAFDEYEHYKMEQTVFPAFHFVALDGTVVSNASMKGKIVVIKCWYIHCAACVKEFPEVNALAAHYKNQKEVLFVSLAEDTAAQLKTFLDKKPLSYLVVPNMKIYMNETLHLNAFPTHIILNKEGRIEKVLSDYESLSEALKITLGL